MTKNDIWSDTTRRPRDDRQGSDTSRRAELDSTAPTAGSGQQRTVAAEVDSGNLTTPAAATPDRLGRFELGAELGRGAMGRVVEGRDPVLDRDVAIKLLLDPAPNVATKRARFIAEARITSQLEHPNIVPVHEMGITSDGVVYFAMKRVVGSSLRSVLNALNDGDPSAISHWSRHRLLTGFVQVCQAVAYAHERRVLHRDLKPQNIMLGAFGEVLVMDWGLAKVANTHTSPPSTTGSTPSEVGVTLDGSLVGTPGYMSPEAALGQIDRLSPASDVWSLGAVLYELLTYQRAYVGRDPLSLLTQAIQGLPIDPRHRTPTRDVSDEIAEVCLRALHTDPRRRYTTAGALASAVEAYMEGSRRKRDAGQCLERGEQAWQRYRRLVKEEQVVDADVRRQREEVAPWAPIDAAEKAALLEATERLEAKGIATERAFGEVLALGEASLVQDPGNAGARQFLARAYESKLGEAEGRRDARAIAYYDDRVREFAPPDTRIGWKRHGSLHLSSDPLGAVVTCRRYEQTGLVWRLGEVIELGRTPLDGVSLAPGSYLLTIHLADHRDTLYPVLLTRGHQVGAERPVPLLTDAQIGREWCYVPAGTFRVGGDPEAGRTLEAGVVHVDGFLVRQSPVTSEQYCEFLNAIHTTDPELAWSRVPRHSEDLEVEMGRFWARPVDGLSYRIPERDPDGDLWLPDWPVMGISWDDAVAYSAWDGRRRGETLRLPNELEWEKAARGIDGRYFPWGDRFDPSLCKMQQSRPGRPQPESVAKFAGDTSVYGVRDLAGGVREWCGDAAFDGDLGRRPVRGGGWSSTERVCRLANRFGLEPMTVRNHLGFRLLRPLPLPRCD